MARPRQPTALLDLKGAFQRNPQRKREAEPTPETKIGAAPKHLSEPAKKAWGEMAREGGSWLTGADRQMLEVASVLQAEFRASPTEMQASKMALLVKTLNDLGFGPAARTRIKAPQAKEPEVNPFAAFN